MLAPYPPGARTRCTMLAGGASPDGGSSGGARRAGCLDAGALPRVPPSIVSNGEPLDAGAPTWSVQLPHFEGPLDLLLHLCQKHELNILDIPVGLLTEKYLEYLAVMQLMELDVAAEYLVMAATLAHIK